MEPRIARLNRIAPRRIRVQAALWVTELHGPDRDATLEARVRNWIAEDPRHAAAFELATEAWQRSGNLHGNTPGSLLTGGPHGKASLYRPHISAPALAGMIAVCAVCIYAVYFLRNDTLATGPAEQKTIELSDGTEVSLNANSRVIVQYDKHVRKVTLANGEALFTVTKNQPRPFVVVTGDRKVIAMGTSFLVRREENSDSSFAVTLVEGRVAIEPVSWPDVLPNRDTSGLKMLVAGERLRYTGNATGITDSPSIEKVTAWRLGELIFDDTSLTDAAREFNRYGKTKIVIDDPAVGRLRIGGVFRIGDPVSFAQSMVNVFQLRIINRGNSIILVDQQSDAK